MEIWQYKYEIAYDLSSMDRKDMKKAQLRQRKLEKWTKDITTNTESSVNSSTSSHDCLAVPSSPTLSTATSPSAISQYDEKSLIKMQKFMESLPWYDLPLADSIAFNPKQKWRQCNDIYNKFIADNAFCSINVSYFSVGKIHFGYDKLARYAMENKRKIVLQSVGSESSANNDHSHDVTVTVTPSTTEAKEREPSPAPISVITPPPAAHLQVEMTLDYHGPAHDQDKIVNDEQFEKELMELFDVAIKDVIQNLNDSLMRFTSTDYFKLIHNN